MGLATDMLEALELDFPNTVKERQKQYGVRDAYRTISWVYACTNLIADCISGVEFQLYRLNRKKEPQPLKITDPAYTCFYPPKKGEIHTLSEMIKMQFLHLGLFGESFATLTRKGRKVDGVELHNPLYVTPKFSADGSKVEYWRVISVTASGGQKQERKIPSEEMIQWKYPNPYNPFRGLSPLAAARMAIEQDMNMATWNAGFFQNGIRNPIALLLKQTFNPTQREEFMNKLRRNFMGFAKGQLPLLVEGGVDIKVLANTIKDLDFVEGKSLTREELCAVYNVPPAQVGIFRYANYANSREQRSILYLNNLKPKMMYYRDVFNQTILIPNFPGVLCDFVWNQVDAFREDPAVDKTQAEAIKIRAEAATALWGMGYDQKQISVLVGDKNFDPSENTPDPSLENIFDNEEDSESDMTDSGSDQTDEGDEASISGQEPAKDFSYVKAKGLTRIYATSEALRNYAIMARDSIVVPRASRLEKYIKFFIQSKQKASQEVRSDFWVTQWTEGVEPILDGAFSLGFQSGTRDSVRKHQPLDSNHLNYEPYAKLKRSLVSSILSNGKIVLEEAKGYLDAAQSIVHRAYILGRMYSFTTNKVLEIAWCCAGDTHQEIHGAKTKLGSEFSNGMSYPGEWLNGEKFCSCTVFPTEVVRDDRVPVVKKA